MAGTKIPVTVRIAPDLLAQVRVGAARDNRSITNFIETALLKKLVDDGKGGSAQLKNVRKTHGSKRR